MNIYFKKILFLSVIVFFLISCKNSKNEISNNISIDFLDISKVPVVKNNNSKVIDLYVVNKTSDCVAFAYDLGAEIFLKVNGEWIKVKNLVEDASKKDIILTSFSGIEPDTVLFINPDYANLPGKPSDIRVVVHAHLCNNGVPTDDLSSDSIEIPLE